MSPISTKVSAGITGPQPAAVTHGILNLISTGTTLHLISQSCNLFRGNQIHFQLKIFKSFFMTFLTMPVADLGGARDICPPVEILSISCSFWKHLAKSYVAPPPPRVGTPPRGNPGSVTACTSKCKILQKSYFKKYF